MSLNKGLTYLLLAAVTLTPWNATAVNSYGFNKLLHRPQLERLTGVAETLLVKSLLEITQGKSQQALDTINELISKIPNFKLAYLVRGDLLTAQAQHLQAFGNAENGSTEAIKDLRAEARARIEHYLSKQDPNNLPELVLSPNEEQKYVIIVDTDKSRLYLYRNDDGHLNYVSDYYVTIGKNGAGKQVAGDKRTPIGVYIAQPKLKQPLADMYGDGAYPLSYPNEWDRRHNRSGSGIWLHGTPSDTYSRPPNASDGCVVLSNQDLKAIAPILQNGRIPVIIANNLHWQDSEETNSKKESLQKAINTWVNDWRSQDTEKYLAHYSRAFNSNGINYQQWADHKVSVQASKPKVDITLSDISMFSYPDGNKKLVVVDFKQDFRSSALSNKMQKRQYWVEENGTWKIIYEGAS